MKEESKAGPNEKEISRKYFPKKYLLEPDFSGMIMGLKMNPKKS